MSAQATAVLPAPHRAVQEGPDGPDGPTAYVERVFGHLPRSDQRRWADAYLRGLLRTPGRKTVRRMAQTLGLPDSAPQALQQFITDSPWEWATARTELARIAMELLPDAVWTARPVPLRKRGGHTVGVRPRVLPGGDRRVNCQVGVGLFLTGGRHSIPVAWRLLLDDAWCADAERRRRARIPSDVVPRPVWALVLEMLDQLADQGVGETVPLVLGPGFAHGAHRLGEHLARRGRDFVIEVPPGQRLSPVPPRGARPSPGPSPVSDASALTAAYLPKASAARAGRPCMYSTAVRVLPPRGPLPTAHPPHRLVAEASRTRQRPSRFWVTSLPGARTASVRALAHRTAVTDAAVRRLQNESGLLDFEGRSFPGWHHHMTLASAACLYLDLDPASAPAPDPRPGHA